MTGAKMPKKGGVLSPESRRLVSESLKRWWESRTIDERTLHAEVRRGQTCTDEQRAAISASLKDAYARGDRKPLRCGNRKGVAVSAETREKMAKAKRGIPQSEAVIQKRAASLRKAHAEGRATISPKSGYGRSVHYDSPFQGRIRLRSTSEFRRALELDKAGLVWFYEALRFPLTFGGKPTTYTPDFWILPDITRADVPPDVCPKLFLSGYAGLVEVEDVKGWWGPDHRTYPKIMTFIDQYPEVNFSIAIRERHRIPKEVHDVA